MAGPPVHPTLELPRPGTDPMGATQPPPRRPTLVVHGSGPRRWLEWSLGIALLVAIAVAAWQFSAASGAREQLTAMDERLATLEEEVASLRTDNEALRATNEELRGSAAAGDPLSGILAPLLRGETPTEEQLLDLLLPLLRDQLGLGEDLGGLSDLFGGSDLSGLGDLFGGSDLNGLDELFGTD